MTAVNRHTLNLLKVKAGALACTSLVELDCPACGLKGVLMPIQVIGGRRPIAHLVTCSGNRKVELEETPVVLEAAPQEATA